MLSLTSVVKGLRNCAQIHVRRGCVDRCRTQALPSRLARLGCPFTIGTKYDKDHPREQTNTSAYVGMAVKLQKALPIIKQFEERGYSSLMGFVKDRIGHVAVDGDDKAEWQGNYAGCLGSSRGAGKVNSVLKWVPWTPREQILIHFAT